MLGRENMKLTIREDFESTTSIGTENNPVSVFTSGDFDSYAVSDFRLDTSSFDDLEALGFVFTLASAFI